MGNRSASLMLPRIPSCTHIEWTLPVPADSCSPRNSTLIWQLLDLGTFWVHLWFSMVSLMRSHPSSIRTTRHELRNITPTLASSSVSCDHRGVVLERCSFRVCGLVVASSAASCSILPRFAVLLAYGSFERASLITGRNAGPNRRVRGPEQSIESDHRKGQICQKKTIS